MFNLPFLKILLAAALRNGLKMLGLVGLVTDTQLNEVVSAIMLLVGFGWTVYRAYKEARSKAKPEQKPQSFADFMAQREQKKPIGKQVQ